MIYLRLLQPVTLGTKVHAAGSLMALGDAGQPLADQLIQDGKAERYRPPTRVMKQMQQAVDDAHCCGS